MKEKGRRGRGFLIRSSTYSEVGGKGRDTTLVSYFPVLFTLKEKFKNITALYVHSFLEHCSNL